MHAGPRGARLGGPGVIRWRRPRLKIVLRILGYLKPYWRRLTIAYVALFTALALQLYIPRLLGQAIDNALNVRDSSYLVRTAAIIVVLAIFQGLFTFLREEQLHGWTRRTILMRNCP